MAKTFIEITNKDIYEEIRQIKKIVRDTNGKVKFNRKWLWAISGVFCTGFLFLISFLR